MIEINDDDDDDEDYMSENILKLCSANDIRPGLLFTKQLTHEHNLYKKKMSTPSFRALSAERLKEGLNTSLPSTNKGFQIMEKMGYKPGMGIGKDESGVVVPLPIEVKAGVHGLGHRNERLRKYRKLASSQVSVTEYRDFVRKRNELHECKWDYKKIQHVCYDLDSVNDVLVPVQNWYWPPSVTKTSESNEDSDLLQESSSLQDVQFQERVNTINEYIRKKYRYCYWCGCRYDNESDFAATCPGNTNRQHQEEDIYAEPVTSTESD